jgi:hypothetical protein
MQNRWDRHNQWVVDGYRSNRYAPVTLTRRRLIVGTVALSALASAFTAWNSRSWARGVVGFVACLPLMLGGLLVLRHARGRLGVTFGFAIVFATFFLSEIIVGGRIPTRGGNGPASPTGFALVLLVAGVLIGSVLLGLVVALMEGRRPQHAQMTSAESSDDIA